MKDNLVFGIKERNEAFKSKLGNEDELLSREAWFASDRRCDFWLEFENGVKLLVEMVDKTVPHLEEIPLHEPLPPDALNATSISIKQSIYDEGDSGDVPPQIQIGSASIGHVPAKGLNKNESQKSIGGKPTGKDS